METIIDLAWLPKSKAGGNKRGHWTVQAPAIKDMRFEGYITGLEAKGGSLAPAQPSFPEGDLELTLDVWQAGRFVMDGDNIWTAMKPFIDGLEASELFGNDKQIKRWVLNLKRAPSEATVHMRLTLRPLA